MLQTQNLESVLSSITDILLFGRCVSSKLPKIGSGRVKNFNLKFSNSSIVRSHNFHPSVSHSAAARKSFTDDLARSLKLRRQSNKEQQRFRFEGPAGCFSKKRAHVPQCAGSMFLFRNP